MSNTSKIAFILFYSMSIFLSSCDDFITTVVEVDVSEHSHKVVLNGILEVGQPIAIDLFYSDPIFKDESAGNSVNTIKIEDAQIEVYEDGQLIETLIGQQHEHRDSLFNIRLNSDGDYQIYIRLIGNHYFRYISQAIVKPATEYTLKASSPEYGEVSATTITPSIIPLQSWQFIDTLATPNNEELITCLIDFKDPEQQSYYAFRLMLYRDLYRTNIPPVRFKKKCFYTEEPSFNKTANSPFSNPFLANRYCKSLTLFNDALFAGQHKQLEILIPLKHFENKEKDINKRKIKLSLYSTNKDYYLYQHSLSLHDQSLTNPFAEPVPVYSNTSTGMGILAAFVSSDLIIESR